MPFQFSDPLLRGQSLFISSGGGGGRCNLRESHEKNSTPNGGGGGSKFHLLIHRGSQNMISISFSGIKMLWLLRGEAHPPTPCLIINFVNLSCPLFTPPPPPPTPRHPVLSLIFLIFHAPIFTTTTEKMICIF